MKKVLKIILIILTLFFGLISVFILGEEFFSNTVDISNGRYVFDDYFLLIPLIIFLFSIPSMAFNVKTLKFYRESKKIKVQINDTDLLDTNRKVEKVDISLFYWIGNFLFGLSMIGLSVFILVIVLVNFPLRELPNGIFRYLTSIVIFIFGTLILVDEWKINKQVNGL